MTARATAPVGSTPAVTTAPLCPALPRIRFLRLADIERAIDAVDRLNLDTDQRRVALDQVFARLTCAAYRFNPLLGSWRKYRDRTIAYAIEEYLEGDLI
jgi:hypothetical protein